MHYLHFLYAWLSPYRGWRALVSDLSRYRRTTSDASVFLYFIYFFTLNAITISYTIVTTQTMLYCWSYYLPLLILNKLSQVELADGSSKGCVIGVWREFVHVHSLDVTASWAAAQSHISTCVLLPRSHFFSTHKDTNQSRVWWWWFLFLLLLCTLSSLWRGC